MNVKKLNSAIEQSATANGYHFHSAEERYIPQLTTAYPTLWLTPPTMKQMEGRTHGRITYSLTMHALDAAAKLPPEERNQRWAEMEGDLIGMFTQLSKEDFVVAIEHLTLRQSSHTLTSHGEVAVTATADVITFF